MRKSLQLAALASAAVFLVAACGSSSNPTDAPATAAPATAAPATAAPEVTPEPAATVDPESLLGKVIASGVLRVATDPNYAPFSFLDVATGEYVGYDNATAVEVAKRLSAEARQGDQGPVGDPQLGPDHRWQLGWSLGHLDRLHERHQEP